MFASFESSQLEGRQHGTYYIWLLIFTKSQLGWLFQAWMPINSLHGVTQQRLTSIAPLPSYLLPLVSFGNWRFCGTQGWKIFSSNHSLSQDAIVHTASPSTVSKDQFSPLSNEIYWCFLLPCLTLWGAMKEESLAWEETAK